MPPATKADGAVQRVCVAIAALPPGRYLLAVSGGRDSMLLLDAWSRWRADGAVVATFDHGTSSASRRAAAFVQRAAERRGFSVVTGAARGLRGADEAAWRAARHEFLSGWARKLGARACTAHTRDDQAETVLMRVLRGAGARGLAGMYAASGIARPFLDVDRADVALAAAALGLRFVDDPTNADRRHLRNRVRLDLLPALEGARPGFTNDLLALARRAATWRAGLDRVVDSLCATVLSDSGDASLVVPAASLSGFPPTSLAVLWPALAERAGVTLDRRGLERLCTFTVRSAAPSRVPLSGGAEVRRTGSTFVVRNRGPRSPLY